MGTCENDYEVRTAACLRALDEFIGLLYTVYQVLLIYTTYINSQYLISDTWYMPDTWYCLPPRNNHVITCAARQPRVRSTCTLSAEQSTILLWIYPISTNFTRESIWFLMSNVLVTRSYLPNHGAHWPYHGAGESHCYGVVRTCNDGYERL